MKIDRAKYNKQFFYSSTWHALHHIHTILTTITEARLREQKAIEMKVLNDNRPKTFIVFIDFQKAFDRVNRRKLLEKLESIGIK